MADPPVLVRDPREVERVFHVALSELLSDGVHREERWGDVYGPNRAMYFFELEDESDRAVPQVSFQAPSASSG